MMGKPLRIGVLSIAFLSLFNFAGHGTSYSVEFERTNSDSILISYSQNSTTLTSNIQDSILEVKQVRSKYVSGTIESDQVWSASESPYILEGTGVAVAEGATLTIEPGVEVILPSNDELEINGTLKADGTAEAPIRFHREAGGTEFGGHLEFRSTSTESVLDYVEIEGLAGGNTYGAVSIYGTSAVQLTNSTITGSEDSGLFLDDGVSPKIRNNIFENNQLGIIISTSATPDLGKSEDYGENIFRNNVEFNVQNQTSETIQAIGNFWNDTDASTIDSHIYDDNEDADSGPVNFEPFLYEPPEDGDTGGDVPTITSVEPNPVTGSNSDQPITINGSGFEDGSFVILDDLDDDQGAFGNPSKTTFVSSTELTRQATFTENAATWSAQVKNPDGSRSDTVHFEVIRPKLRSVLAPIKGPFRVTGTENPRCANDPSLWTFCQHQTDLHKPGAGVADADETLAYDMNLSGDRDDERPVFAVSQGKVVKYGGQYSAGEKSGAVLIEHTDGTKKWWSGYLHMKEIYVKVGQEVTTKTRLGKISNVCSCGTIPNHLHYVTYEGENTVSGLQSINVQFQERSGNILAVPSGLSANTNNGNIELSWDANNEEDLAGYNLYRSTSSFSETSEATKLNGSELINEQNYTDDGVEAATTYFYRLTAVDAGGNESGLSDELLVTLERNSPPATDNFLEALISTHEAIIGEDSPSIFEYDDMREEYQNGIKHLAYIDAGVFKIFGVGIYIDADDYVGITEEGYKEDGDGWVTVWVDGSAQIGAGYPPVNFGLTKIKFEDDRPDPLRKMQTIKPGASASLGLSVDVNFLNYEEGRGFLGFENNWEIKKEVAASISLFGRSRSLTRFEIKTSVLDEILNGAAQISDGKVSSLEGEGIRDKFLNFVKSNVLTGIGNMVYAIGKGFDSDNRRDFTYTDDGTPPEAGAYIETSGGGIDVNGDDVPDNFCPVEQSTGSLGWSFLLNVRSLGNTDIKYVVEAEAPSGWYVKNYCININIFSGCSGFASNKFITDVSSPGKLIKTEWRVSVGPQIKSDKADVKFKVYKKGNPENVLDEVTVTFEKYTEKLIVYNGRSPIELKVEAPSGSTVDPSNYDAGLTMYNQFDVDGSGSEDAQVLIASPEKGVHKIEVVPNEDANPEDTYTLEAIENGTIKTLAKNETIGDIPDSSYSYAAGIEPPAFPGNFVLKTNGAQSTLEWQKSSNEFLEGYLLYTGKDPNKLAISDTLANSTTSYPINENGTSYYSISAFDINGNESPLSPWVSYVKDQLSISNQWQMVSNPAITAKNISRANIFRFEGTYKADSVLTAGRGYWVKSEANQGVQLHDQGIDSTQIQLDQGWNLIGSLVDTLNKSAISDPESVIGSVPVYGYDLEESSYEKTSELLPKQGYWLFADQSGTITLNFDTQSSTQKNAANPDNKISENDRLIFSNDTAERNLLYFYSTLGEEDRQQYLLPPVAPAAVMDVRTPNGYRAIDSGSGEINLTAQRYPVQIQIEGQSEGGFVYQIIATDEEKKKTLILTAASPVILDHEYETIRVTRLSEDEVITENDLDPNFPNPFSSTTKIVYRLAETSQVTLNVYDVIGRKVETLVDEEQTTGEYPVTFDGSGLASGVYIIQLKLDEDVKDQKITLIK